MRFAVALLALAACSSPAPAVHAPLGAARPQCVARGPLPDPRCTPGAVETTDLGAICAQSTRERRAVPSSVHRQVLAEYGVPYPPPAGAYEVDHLIPLELGGSNDITNLWAEPAEPRPGFHEKDQVENETHRRVCAGELRIEDAQRQISEDWRQLR